MKTKREAEVALEQTKRIAMHAPVGIQIYGADGYNVFVNDKFNTIFGAAPPPNYCVLNDELVAAAGTLHLIHQAFSGVPTKLPLLWYDARDLQNLPADDLVYTKSFGKKCAIETHMVPMFDHEEKVSHVIFIYTDVTGELYMKEERERALKERDDAKAMIRTVLDETQAVIYIKDLEGRFTFVNGQFCRIFGKQVDEIIGKNDRQLFPPEMAEDFIRNDQRVISTQSHLELEEVAIHADQSIHTYLSLKFPLRDSAGDLYGICGISTDITEHRRLERELNTAKRMESVGLLAGGIAHDFNNIIEVILLVADTLLMTGAKERPDWVASIESMKQSAKRASLLTRQLLAFGRKQTFRSRIINVGSVIEDATEIARRAVGSDIQFTLDIEPGLWPVFADPLQVEQVFTNLCFNARDAMPKGGELKVTVRNQKIKADERQWKIGKPVGDYVELVVSDTGTGIDDSVIDKIFDPFFTTKGDANGSGLGLATVYGIVQSTGGDISVKSAKNRGTVFHVVFPRTDGVATATAAENERVIEPIGGTETILLVEDQEHLRTVTARLLTECGYTVIDAKDAKTAIDIWSRLQKKIDVIITDIVMPGISGLEMIERISKLNDGRSPKAVFVSAYSDKSFAEHNLDVHKLNFIEKPYTANELLRKLRDVLRN